MNKEKIYSLTETWNELFLYAFIFFTPVGNAGGEICFGLLALCFGIRKVLRPDFRFLKKTEHLWLLLFFVFCGLSLVNSGPFLQKSLKALFLKWGEYAMVFLFVREILTSPMKLKRVGWAILTVAALIGIDGLVQFFTGHDLFYARPIQSNAYYQALTATFKNSNNLASYLGLVTPVALAMAATAKTQKSRWIFGVLTLILGVCLLLTFSRGAWLGFICGVLLMTLISRRWKVLLPALFLFVMAILMNASLTTRALPVLSLATGQPTGVAFSERSEILGIGVQLIRENPFLGKGLGTFMDYCGQRAVATHTDYAHNCYLQIWAESGIFSLLAFLLFIGTLIGKGIHAFKREEDPLLLGLLSGIFAFSIHSFFDTQFYSVAQSFLFWSMLGILAAATQNNVSVPETRS